VESVGNHMRFAHVSQMRQAKLKRLLASDNLSLQLELHRIDCISCHAKMDQYVFLLDKLNEDENAPTLPEPLINGNDLIHLQVSPGPEIGKILKKISDMQLEGELTTKEEALEEAMRLHRK